MADDMGRVVGRTWMYMAQGWDEWRVNEKVYTQQWMVEERSSPSASLGVKFEDIIFITRAEEIYEK